MLHLLTDPAIFPGLLFATRFEADGTSRPIEAEIDELRAPTDGGFLWLHLDLVDARIEGPIAQGRLGPAPLASATFSRDEHQRVVVDGPWIGLVLCDRERAFDGTVAALPTSRLHCLIGPEIVITGRRRASAGAEAVRDAVLAGRRVASPAHLVELCVDGVIHAAHLATVTCSDSIDGIEDRLLDGEGRADAGALAPLRRKAVRLQRQLSGLHAVVHRLETELDEPEECPETVKAMAARVVQRLDALHRDMQLLSERSRLLQDEIAARTAAETNRQLFTLSILTALLLPPTLVTGVFGMNTKGLFLADFENGSTIALGIGALAAFAVYLIIRRLGIVRPRG
ncbi:MAG: magnesium transporter CorA [Methylobacterium sp.]|uniref:CorA family divalent cation transporter n=1 Tax=Methylobacterium sp. TaxID=409 RepID=UPI0025DAD045|nr:CorA family divalent cation transporter [Methylobacterium sp.]MBX9931322.1 magnesium transporter CorA [Methylobacterium sp.]